MEKSLKTGFAQIFSCWPKNLSCPNFGGAAAPLAPPARTPMNLLIRWLFLNFTPFVMPAEIRQIIFVTLNHFFMLWISFFIFAIPCILSCSLLSSFEKWCPLTLHFLDFLFLHPFNKENKWPRVCKKTDKECVTVQ